MTLSDDLIRQAMSQTPVSGQAQSAPVNDFVKQFLLRPRDTFGSRISRGFRGSVSGIALGQGLSLEELKARGVQDPNFVMDTIEGLATVVGDLPGILLGSVAGAPAGPIGEVAAAFATPEIIKSMYREYLNAVENSDQPFTFADFVESAANVFKSGAVAAGEGAIFGATARALEPLLGMKQFREFFHRSPAKFAKAFEKGAKKLGIDLAKTPISSLSADVVDNILKAASPVRGAVAGVSEAVIGKIPTEAGKSVARGAVTVAAESAALTTASAMIGHGDFSIEAFTRNLAILVPFKIGHAFANYVREIAMQHGLEKVVETLQQAGSEAEATELLQITYQPDKRAKTLERKGLKEGERGDLQVKRPVEGKEAIEAKGPAERKRLAEEKRKQIEHKKREPGEAIPLGTDVEGEAQRTARGGEKFQKKLEGEKKRLREFDVGQRVTNKAIREGTLLSKKGNYGEVKLPDGKVKRRKLTEEFETLVPEKVRKKAEARIQKAEKERMKLQVEKEALKKEKVALEKQIKEFLKPAEHAPGFIAELTLKGEKKLGEIVHVRDKTVTIRDPETGKLHIRKKSSIKVVDKSKGTQPDLIQTHLEAKRKGKSAIGEEDWVYSIENKKDGTRKVEPASINPHVGEHYSEKPSAPIGRKNLIESIESKFKISIKKGGIKDRRAKGIFKEHDRVIRTRQANDIKTAFHELAHDIDRNVMGRDFTKPEQYKELEPFRHELEEVATLPKSMAEDPIHEGFAEAVRIWLEDRTLSERETPEFKRYWERKLADEYPEVLQHLDEIHREYQEWKNQSDENWVKGEIVYDVPETFTEKAKRFMTKQGFKDVMGELYYKFTHGIIDVFEGLKFFSPSAYRMARVSAGMHGKIQGFIKNYTHKFGKPLEPTGKPLEAIIEPAVRAANGSYRDFDAYLAAKRAINLAERPEPIKTQFEYERAKRVAEKYEKQYPEFKKAGEELQVYQDHLLQYLRDSGILSEKAYKDIKDANEFYVPFYRFLEAANHTGGLRHVDSLEAFNPIRKIKGGTEALKSPLESIYKNTAIFINLAERNGILQQLYNDLRGKENIGSIFEGIEEESLNRKTLLEEAHELTGDSVTTYELANESLLRAALDEAAVHGEGNRVKIFLEGRPYVFEVDPKLYDAIKGLRREEIPTLMKFFEFPAKTLRIGATMTPDFMLRAFMRDIPEALFKTQYGISIPDIFKGLAESYRGVTGKGGGSKLYEQWQAAGGSHSGFVSMNRGHFVKNMDMLMKKWGGMKNVILNEKMGLQVLSEILESAPRLAEFKKGLEVERQRAGGELSRAAIERAALSSRGVTIDFARMGSYMSVWNRLVPFANAHMQGWWTFFEAFHPKLHNGVFTAKDTLLPIKRLATAMIMPTMLLSTLNIGQKWFNEVPQYQKDNFWLFKFPGTDQILRLPKPYEMSIVANGVERFLEFAQGTDPKAFEKWRSHLVDLSVPLYMPAMVAPMIEGWADKTFFTGRPLTPQDVKGHMAQYQAGVYTSETAKKLARNLANISGDKLTVSPVIIDNYIRAWTGTMGLYALRLADWSLEKAGLVKTIKPESRWADYPLLRAFMVNYPLQGSQSVNAFFDKYNTLVEKERTIKALTKQGQFKEAAKLRKDFKGVLGKSAYKSLINMMGTVKGIYKNDRMSPKEKRDLIDQIYFQMTTVASAVLPQLDEDYRRLVG